MRVTFSVLVWLSLAATSLAFDYELASAGEITVTDQATGISGIQTIFTNDEVAINLEGLKWAQSVNTSKNEDLHWQTLVQGRVEAMGVVSLTDYGRQLPRSLQAGVVTIKTGGRTNIVVVLTILGSQGATASKSVEVSNIGMQEGSRIILIRSICRLLRS